MRDERIPVSYKQVALIGLLVSLPVLIGAGIVLALPVQQGNSNSGWITVVGLLVLSGFLLVSICGSILTRRSVELCDDVLTVRTSFYTLSLRRDEVGLVKLSQVSSEEKIGITTKRNGVAAFKYFSGWFNGVNGNKVFCAVSTYPICYLAFTNGPKCGALAVSYTDSIAKLVEEWIVFHKQ